MFTLGSISQFYKFKYLLLSYVDNIKEGCPLKVVPKKLQSPISIKRGDATSRSMCPLKFNNYQMLYRIAVENTGHTINVHFITTSDEEEEEENEPKLPIPSITGGPLEAEYLLDHIHFHWKSEHVLDGIRYPLEAHFVHYRSDLELKKAKLSEHGIVVVSVMYDLTKCAPETFDEVADIAQEVSDEFDCPTLTENRLCCRDFLPKHINSFYTYEGSLTTPDYNEGVIWIVFDEPSRIDRRQFKKLTQILGHDNKIIVNNYRELQELNDRPIYYNGGIFDKIRRCMRYYMRRKDAPEGDK